jgi:hypothetical protein
MQPLLGLEPGTWADWASAAATSLAFLVALVLFMIAVRDRREAADDRLRDQARKVWLWTEWTGPDVGRASRRMTLLLWTIDNQSDEPVLECRVDLDSTPTAQVAAKSPDAWLVKPREQWGDNLLSDAHPELQGRVYRQSDRGPILQLVFTDAAGVQWRRDSLGHLSLWRRPRPTRPAPRVGCAVLWYGPHQ